jgi:hypothetical protein
MKTLKFRTWDSANSTFCRTFETFKEAEKYFEKRIEANEECTFGLKVVIDEDGIESLEKDIFRGECVSENGRIVEKIY